jgi:hypothetical protein
MQQVLPGYQEKDKPYKPDVLVLTGKLMTLLPYNNTIAIKNR